MDKFEILKVVSKNLRNTDYRNIFKLISELGLSNLIGFQVPENTYIYRIRPTEKKPFTKTSQISYNPICKNFGRANKPNYPIFYGAIQVPSMENPIFTNTAEILHVLKNGGHSDSIESTSFTIGKWKLKNKLPVVPMIFHDEFLMKNNLFNPLNENYAIENIENNKNIEIVKFIANEFAKHDINYPDDYKISAAFSEIIFKGYKDLREAIIYPSVRASGNGYNIALTPNFTEKYLSLTEVRVFRIKDKKGIGHITFEKKSENIKSDGTFELIDFK